MSLFVVTAHVYLTVTVEADTYDDAEVAAEALFEKQIFADVEGVQGNDIDPGAFLVDDVQKEDVNV